MVPVRPRKRLNPALIAAVHEHEIPLGTQSDLVGFPFHSGYSKLLRSSSFIVSPVTRVRVQRLCALVGFPEELAFIEPEHEAGR